MEIYVYNGRKTMVAVRKKKLENPWTDFHNSLSSIGNRICRNIFNFLKNQTWTTIHGMNKIILGCLDHIESAEDYIIHHHFNELIKTDKYS